MSTKADLLKRIASLPEDAIIAIPVLWTKQSAQDGYNYMEDPDSEIEISDEDWVQIVERYELGDYYGDEDMIEAIKHVLAIED